MLLIDIQRLHGHRRWPREPEPRNFPKPDQVRPNWNILAERNRVQTTQQCQQVQAVHHLERRWLL